jgi:hypothetical protein
VPATWVAVNWLDLHRKGNQPQLSEDSTVGCLWHCLAGVTWAHLETRHEFLA